MFTTREYRTHYVCDIPKNRIEIIKVGLDSQNRQLLKIREYVFGNTYITWEGLFATLDGAKKEIEFELKIGEYSK